MQEGNDSKHVVHSTWDFISEKKCMVLDRQSQSQDLHPTGNTFHLLKIRLKGEIPRNKRTESAVKAWNHVSKEEQF